MFLSIIAFMYAIVRIFQFYLQNKYSAYISVCQQNHKKKDRNKIAVPRKRHCLRPKKHVIVHLIELKDIPPIPRGEMSHK